MSQPTAIVIGAGIGGLATAIRLRTQGWQVIVFEASAQPGGKIGELRMGAYRFDTGPSLFTLPSEVDELFRLAGKNPADHFRYRALPVVTKYFYEDGVVIPAWWEPEKFAEEIEKTTADTAASVHKSLARSSEIYDITGHVFLERSLHKVSNYLRKQTLRSILRLPRIDAFRTMHAANAKQFTDPRVVQLFDRYATYNGSDPYQAPATLNVIPHLEHNIGAFFPEGGMFSIARSLHELGKSIGVKYFFNTPVDRILLRGRRAMGVFAMEREWLAEAVVSNADIVPTYRRLLPQLKAPERTLSQPRSSSALIFYWAMNRTWPQTDTHNIFFSSDYPAEFDALWNKKTLADDLTVYLYVSSKAEAADAPEGCENWFVMVNAPANTGQDWDALIPEARTRSVEKLERMLGTPVESHIQAEQVLDPRSIEAKTSSYQGALYGNSSNNKFAAFLRHPNFKHSLPGLYFVGGSVHPGGGIPLCLLSAKITGDLIGKAGA